MNKIGFPHTTATGNVIATSVRPKELTAGNFGEIFGQFSAETVSPP